jgi:NADPH:quinone reductase-like Zn-dependent oxidoreductase
MKALVFERNGDPSDVLTVQELPDPRPGPGEILVRVRCASVNPSDLHVLRGRFGRQPALPASPGTEAMGVVEALGEGVQGPALGTRVALLNVWGTWRERLVAPAERVVPVPDSVSDEDAAQALVNPVTAWVLTMIEHRLKPGDWLAQTAAGSTVGRLVLQLAQSEGFHTINLVRRQAQVAEINDLGGDVTLCTEDAEWAATLARSADGKAPDAAIDCVAGRTGALVARHLAPGGRLLIYGALSSHRQTEPSAFEMPIFSPRLIYDGVAVQGWFLFRWLEVTPLAECMAVLCNVLERMANRSLRLPPAKRHRIENVAVALADAEGSGREAKPLLNFEP